MKRFWLAFIAVMGMAGLSRSADAQEAPRLIATLSNDIQTVVAAVEKEGCYPSRELLNRVLKESKIKYSNVTRLPAGQKVYMSGTCDKKVSFSGASKNSRKPVEKNVAVTQTVTAPVQMVVYDSVSIKENIRLKQAMQDTVKKLTEQVVEAQASSSGHGLIFYVFIFIMGFLTALIISWVLTWYEKKKKVFKPKKSAIPRHQVDNDPNPTP